MTSRRMEDLAEKEIVSYAGKKFSFEEVRPHIAQAWERARRLEAKHAPGSPVQLRNPSTTMWAFIESLRDNGWAVPGLSGTSD